MNNRIVMVNLPTAKGWQNFSENIVSEANLCKALGFFEDDLFAFKLSQVINRAAEFWSSQTREEALRQIALYAPAALKNPCLKVCWNDMRAQIVLISPLKADGVASSDDGISIFESFFDISVREVTANKKTEQKSAKSKDVKLDDLLWLGNLQKYPDHSVIAKAFCDRLVETNSGNFTPIQTLALIRVANLTYQFGQFELAWELFSLLLKFNDPAISKNASVLNRMALCTENLGRLDEAMDLFRKLIEYDKSSASSYNTARREIARGNIKDAMPLAEVRWQWEDYPAIRLTFDKSIKKWDGELLENKHLLVWGEQGVADQMLGLSMVPAIDAIYSPRSLTILVAKKLRAPVQLLFPRANVPLIEYADCSNLDFGSRVDYEITVFEIAKIFFSRPQAPAMTWSRPTIPDNALTGFPHVKSSGKKVIGVCWRTHMSIAGRVGTRKDLNAKHILPLRILIKIMASADPSVHFLVFQYGMSKEETTIMEAIDNVTICPFADLMFDRLDLQLAFVNQLDGLIAHCSIPVHFAAFLKIKTFTWLPTRHWYLYGNEFIAGYRDLVPSIIDDQEPQHQIDEKLLIDGKNFVNSW